MESPDLSGRSKKLIHTLILDTGPIIKNEPPISTLLAQSEALVTVPSVLSEIRDAATRTRIETMLKPFLTFRSPSPNSVKVITDFARKTGDLEVLSRPDLLILALAYELECERNGGDWRLRGKPGQRDLNGPNPKKPVPNSAEVMSLVSTPEVPSANPKDQPVTEEPPASAASESGETTALEESSLGKTLSLVHISSRPTAGCKTQSPPSCIERKSSPNPAPAEDPTSPSPPNDIHIDSQDDDSASETSDLDTDGWVTPSNIRAYQAAEGAHSTPKSSKALDIMQVATLTTDFAMQNVLLQMNLNLLSPSLQRIRHLRTYILRCHACFSKTKDMSKQFCTRCGKPTLMRVSCSTAANGEFRIYLKKNMQWNHRGDKFSIPKPVGGSSSGKLNVGGGGKGGGKGGWGTDLILAEDQKEYQLAMTGQRRRKERNLMDEDYLPGILTGERRDTGGRVKVGGGRNINSRKRMN